MKAVRICSVVVWLLFGAGSYPLPAGGECPDGIPRADEKLKAEAEKRAYDFLAKLPDQPAEIASARLAYTAKIKHHLHMDARIVLTLKRTGSEQAGQGDYRAKIKAELSGSEPFSRFIWEIVSECLAKYRRIKDDFDLEIEERFIGARYRFETRTIEEFRPPELRARKMIKVSIRRASGLAICFWPDKNAEQRMEVLPFHGQVGPITGFFNYVFRSAADAIDAIEIVEDGFDPERSEPVKKLRSQRAVIKRTGAGDLPNRVEFPRRCFFGLITDGIDYAEAEKAGVRIPYLIRLDGLVDTSRRKERLAELYRRGQTENGRELFTPDVLLAEHVYVYLEEAGIEEGVVK